MDYKKIIADKISDITNIAQADALVMLEVPQKSEMGDFALPCFKLSKVMRKSPVMIADELKEAFGDTKGFSSIESLNGYLNFFVNKLAFAQQTLSEILEMGR